MELTSNKVEEKLIENVKSELVEDEFPEEFHEFAHSLLSVKVEAFEDGYLTESSGDGAEHKPLDGRFCEGDRVKESLRRPREEILFGSGSGINTAKSEGDADRKAVDVLSHLEPNAAAKGARDEPIFTCPECPYENTKKRLKTHIIAHHMFKPYKCAECSYTCRWKSTFNRHMLRHSQNYKVYKCDACDYSTKFKVSYDRHLLKHAQMYPHVCDKCEYKSHSRGNLYSHMRKHAETRRYACAHCDYWNVRKCQLAAHMRVHFSDMPVRKRDSRPARKRLGPTPKQQEWLDFFSDEPVENSQPVSFVPCPVCDAKFTSKRVMETHKIKHLKVDDIKCEFCSYSTYRKDLLRSHLLTHTLVKRYKCPDCDFTSQWSHCITRHTRSKHLNFKPYKCSDCDYAAVEKRNLRKHILSHHGAPREEKLKLEDAKDFFLKNFSACQDSDPGCQTLTKTTAASGI